MEGRFSARVGGLPEVQARGRSYFVRVVVRNQGPWLKNFCLDFGDSNNSWLIRMSGLRAYDSDTFCAPVLKGGVKTFIARLVPAKSGQKKLSIAVGPAKIYSNINRALVDSEKGLYWEDSFVIL